MPQIPLSEENWRSTAGFHLSGSLPRIVERGCEGPGAYRVSLHALLAA